MWPTEAADAEAAATFRPPPASSAAPPSLQQGARANPSIAAALRPRARRRFQGRRRALGVAHSPGWPPPVPRAAATRRRKGVAPNAAAQFRPFLPASAQIQASFFSLPVLESGREETPGSGLYEGRAQPACARPGSRRSATLGATGVHQDCREVSALRPKLLPSLPGERTVIGPMPGLPAKGAALFSASDSVGAKSTKPFGCRSVKTIRWARDSENESKLEWEGRGCHRRPHLSCEGLVSGRQRRCFGLGKKEEWCGVVWCELIAALLPAHCLLCLLSSFTIKSFGCSNQLLGNQIPRKQIKQ